MCELLIRNINNIHPDPEKDLMSYKRGDIVEVRDDGSPYGTAELSNRFRILKLPGVPKEEYKNLYQREEIEPLKNVIPKSAKGRMRLRLMKTAERKSVRRRAHYVDDTNNIIDKRIM